MSMPRCRSIWTAVPKQRLTSSRKAAPKQIRESVCRESPPRLSEAASFTADAEHDPVPRFPSLPPRIRLAGSDFP